MTAGVFYQWERERNTGIKRETAGERRPNIGGRAKRALERTVALIVKQGYGGGADSLLRNNTKQIGIADPGNAPRARWGNHLLSINSLSIQNDRLATILCLPSVKRC